MILKSVKHRRYSFTSHWQIPAPIKVVDVALLNTKDWQVWWSGLEDIKIVHGSIGVGSEFICTWRSMSGYKIHIKVTITQYDKGRDIAFNSGGDLVGNGDFHMQSVNDSLTNITINWNVATTKTWMNLFGPVLKPFFVFNHNQLMRKGEVGLADYIANAHHIHHG